MPPSPRQPSVSKHPAGKIPGRVGCENWHGGNQGNIDKTPLRLFLHGGGLQVRNNVSEYQ